MSEGKHGTDTKTPNQRQDVRRHAPATQRNRAPILEILRRVLPPAGSVLEVASGSGEHAVFFAPRLTPRYWLPSDPDTDNRKSIHAWAEVTPAARGQLRLPPLDLDVRAPVWPVESEAIDPAIAAIVAINLVHISPWEVCEGLMAGAGRILAPGGVLYLYGPYRIDGRHTAPSNEQFDRWLKAQDPRYGVRDLEAVEETAARHGLRLTERIAMPANNFSLVFIAGNPAQ